MPLDGIVQSVNTDFLTHVIRHTPAHDLLSADIYYSYQIHCVFACDQLRNFYYPDSTGFRNVELLVQKVLRNGEIMY